YVNGMRIGTDVDASCGGIQAPARAAGFRSFYHRAAWLNDPDCLLVRPPLSAAEAQVWTAIVAVCGGVTVLSDNLPKLPPDRLSLLQRAIPAAPVAGHPRGTATLAREVAPAIVAGDDVDETFLNGVKLGQTGAFPPNYRSEWQAYRRYRIPVDALNWGGENVLAVRVYDGAGPGGIWSVRRDPPPAHWVVEGAPRWWTVALVNWEDELRQLAVPLGTLGIDGAKFDAYDG